MTVPETVPTPSASLPLPSWRRPLLLLGGGVVVSEGLAHLLPVPPSTWMGGVALAGGWWLLSRRRSSIQPRLPRSLDGWQARCERVLEQLERLGQEAGAGGSQEAVGGDSLVLRRAALQALNRVEVGRPLSVALASSQPPVAERQGAFLAALQGERALRLHWGEALPARSADWRWGNDFEAADVVLFHLREPLRASDLRWLEALPAGQPLWLLLEAPAGAIGPAEDLCSLWPAADPDRFLAWDGSAEGLAPTLAPLTSWLAREGRSLPERSARRQLEALHGHWQAELEVLRRGVWQRLQQRTQWLVAAAVVASPLASVDLLVLTCANGLMLRDMAQLWDCPWDSEALRAAALELGRAALALGLVEWSSQALSTALRLHHAGWLIGGALQALSAAYLTRVVGHAMADVLALSAGVSEPDLEAIRRQAPMLVARAAEAERLDWATFLQQSLAWLRQQAAAGGTPALQQST